MDWSAWVPTNVGIEPGLTKINWCQQEKKHSRANELTDGAPPTTLRAWPHNECGQAPAGEEDGQTNLPSPPRASGTTTCPCVRTRDAMPASPHATGAHNTPETASLSSPAPPGTDSPGGTENRDGRSSRASHPRHDCQWGGTTGTPHQSSRTTLHWPRSPRTGSTPSPRRATPAGRPAVQLRWPRSPRTVSTPSPRHTRGRRPAATRCPPRGTRTGERHTAAQLRWTRSPQTRVAPSPRRATPAAATPPPRDAPPTESEPTTCTAAAEGDAPPRSCAGRGRQRGRRHRRTAPRTRPPPRRHEMPPSRGTRTDNRRCPPAKQGHGRDGREERGRERPPLPASPPPRRPPRLPTDPPAPPMTPTNKLGPHEQTNEPTRTQPTWCWMRDGDGDT